MFGFHRSKAKAFRFGKARARADKRTLKFSKYVTPEMPVPPASYTALDRVAKAFGTSDVSKIFPMDGNDRYGDCVFAGAAHMVTNFAGLVGEKNVPCEKQVVSAYLKWTGGVDEGTVMIDMIKEWVKSGFFGEKIDAFVSLHRADHLDVKRAIFYFGGVYLGFEVQDACLSDFENGTPWTPGPTDGSGHCVAILGYDDKYLYILTWGGIIRATWDWWDRMVDEAYVLLSIKAKNPKFDPGFNYAQLEKDLQAIKRAA